MKSKPTPELKPVKVFTYDLSAYQFFREHAGDSFDGGCYYNGTIDTVVALMEGYYKQQKDKHAQPLAKEVVEGLEASKFEGSSNGAVSYNNATRAAIELIKSKFQL